VRGVISEEEYKREKAQLFDKKFDNSDGGNPDGDWHERFKSFLTLAHQASYIAAEANFEAQRDFLRRAVSNLKLLDGNLIISYTSEFKTLAETANEDMGSLSYETRGNLSVIYQVLDTAKICNYRRKAGHLRGQFLANLSDLSGHFCP